MAVFTRRATPVPMAAVLSFVVAWGCDDTEVDSNPGDSNPPAVNTGGSEGAGGTTVSASGGLVIVPPSDCGGCADGFFCSALLKCAPLGTCLADADCGDGKQCNELGQCATGGDCGASEFDISSVPPNLLLVLDRSCSMTMSRTDTGVDVSEQKWVPVIDALVQVTTALGGEIRFGLEVFPDGQDAANSCAQDPTGAIAVPIGPDGGAQTATLLQAARTDDTHPIYPGDPCETNTWSALVQASQQVELDDPERASYVVLITDGEPYCSDRRQRNEVDDDLINEVIADLAERGVPTFVVGFGDAADVDPAALARYAAAGGTTPSAEEPYYDAADGDQLLTALNAIAGSIVSCEYTLDSAPPDDDLYVLFDDTTLVPRDPTHVDGWDFNAETRTLSFFGQACAALQQDLVADIDVVYGCPDPVLG